MRFFVRGLFFDTLSRLGSAREALRTEPAIRRMLLGDILLRCSKGEKTGLLNIAVVQSKRFLIRVYFNEGSICRLTFGPLHGKELLEFLDYYDLSAAVYLDGIKAPRNTCSDIPTEEVITTIMALDKMVRLTQ